MMTEFGKIVDPSGKNFDKGSMSDEEYDQMKERLRALNFADVKV